MKSNFCANCGKDLGGTANFCPKCGHVADTQTAVEGEVLSHHPDKVAHKQDLSTAAQASVFVLCGLFGVYLFFVCTLLLIAIFKFNILVGLLLFLIGFLGAGILYSPLWVVGGGAAVLVYLANETKGSFGRFCLLVVGTPAVMAVAYGWLLLVTLLVNAIIN